MSEKHGHYLFLFEHHDLDRPVSLAGGDYSPRVLPWLAQRGYRTGVANEVFGRNELHRTFMSKFLKAQGLESKFVVTQAVSLR